MSAEHTWGEGVVVNNPDCPHSETGSNAASIYWGNTYVADVYRGYVGSENVSRNEQAANARLIAAAPKLLEALQSIVQDYDFCKGDIYGDRSFSYAETARDAIAKATGSTS